MKRRSLRVGIDVGGTFTDLVAIESSTGRIVTRKVPSTPKEPHSAVIAALRSLLQEYPERPTVEFLGHSTTIATNALLGQIGLELPRVALVTTGGFRDVIEIGRQNRSELYNLFVERPRPLVAREDRLTVRERIDYQGRVLEALDPGAIAAVCDKLRERDVSAVAICLLHSYANDAHERLLAEALRAALPRARIARSSDVDREYREYERCSTTVVNAALAPIVETYLARLTAELRALEIAAPFFVMRSDGGMASVLHVAARAATLIESGPASGAIAAAALSRRTGTQRVLSFDMGGTTAKAATIVDGTAQVAYEFEAAGATHSGRAVKGSGYPVRFPFVDLAEVSAGGGTVAWIDDAGALRVGPVSAGADPGPACYGRSDRPTVTDADVTLGRLNPVALLNGDFPIDAMLARRAIEPLAVRLGMTIEAAAAGILALVDDAMAKALRIVTIERGLDPRDFTLVAFGGGGPLHACAVAEALEIDRIVIPHHPGLFSALGLLEADLTISEVLPILSNADSLDTADVQRAFQRSEDRARISLIEQGAHPQTLAFHRQCDARYCGQSFELTVDFDASPATLAQRFHDAHRARYGYDAREEAVEIVNVRLNAAGKVMGAHASAPFVPRQTQDNARKKRRAWIDEAFIDVPVFARDGLGAGAELDGPAIVEEYDSTTYVPKAWSLRMQDELLVLLRSAR
jgi:N-methylhydantoinase A